MKSEDTTLTNWTNLDLNRIGMMGIDPNAAKTQISSKAICAFRRPSVRSYCATVGKIDSPTVRCDDGGADGDNATVSRDNTASKKAICSIGSCASNVLDYDDLGWTIVNRGSNKSKSKI